MMLLPGQVMMLDQGVLNNFLMVHIAALHNFLIESVRNALSKPQFDQ